MENSIERENFLPRKATVKMNNNIGNKEQKGRAHLTKEEMEFIEKLGRDSLFSTGSKLSRLEIMGALVDAAIALDVSIQGVRSKKELIQKMIDTIYLNSDRRRYPRLKRDLIVKFRKIESMEHYEYGAMDNMGTGGFRIDVAFLGRPLAVNQTVEVSIKEPEEKDETMRAIGRVIWIKEKEDKYSHELGVMLTYIKKENRARFLKYLGRNYEELDLKS
jgi:hypothetical protein